MSEKLEKLKKFLEERRKGCLEQKQEETLTKEGEGMLLLLDNIYKFMKWEKPQLKRKACKMTKREKLFWEQTYHDYVSKGINENKLHELTDKATKKQFPRLKGFDKLL